MLSDILFWSTGRVPPGESTQNHPKNDLTHQSYPVFCAEYHGTIGWVDSLTRFCYFEVDSPRENSSIFRNVWFRAPFGLPRQEKQPGGWGHDGAVQPQVRLAWPGLRSPITGDPRGSTFMESPKGFMDRGAMKRGRGWHGMTRFDTIFIRF